METETSKRQHICVRKCSFGRLTSYLAGGREREGLLRLEVNSEKCSVGRSKNFFPEKRLSQYSRLGSVFSVVSEMDEKCLLCFV